MAILQPLVDLAEICARRGVNQVILSPGSRCAPLTLAFVRHPAVTTRSIPDERSAAFMALGMAQATGQTVALVCTSGTAVLNYAPAVAEAFFQQVPLLLFTADRPAEWIAQQDGQTIYQREIYGKHVKASYDLPADYTHPDAMWHIGRVLNEAISLAQTYPPGPVHVNVPVREPFYPVEGETMQFDPGARVIERMAEQRVLTPAQWQTLRAEWDASPRVLVVAGQSNPDPAVVAALGALGQAVPVVADVISNLPTLPGRVAHQDVFLVGSADALAPLRPDLLITFGLSVISKNLKVFLRQHRPRVHWHVQPAGPVADAFQTLTRIIPADPTYFFAQLAALPKRDPDPAYATAWRTRDAAAGQLLTDFLQAQPFGEFVAVAATLAALPPGSLLHLGNSMPVRYANLLSVAPDVAVYANRGTSGIDGSTSTAVGAALTTDRPVTLLTGDVAFFYDRNALWNNYLPPNLRIVLFNNHGGNIFRLLDGPGRQPELDTYFETHQPLTAARTAADANVDYQLANTTDGLAEVLRTFFDQSPRPKLLEITTDGKQNADVFAAYRATVSGKV